jgi:hypothetical protein
LTNRGSGPEDEPTDAVFRSLQDFWETMRLADRAERMRRLIAAVSAHYWDTGEAEPHWLTIARERFGDTEGKNDQRRELP